MPVAFFGILAILSILSISSFTTTILGYESLQTANEITHFPNVLIIPVKSLHGICSKSIFPLIYYIKKIPPAKKSVATSVGVLFDMIFIVQIGNIRLFGLKL